MLTSDSDYRFGETMKNAFIFCSVFFFFFFFFFVISVFVLNSFYKRLYPFDLFQKPCIAEAHKAYSLSRSSNIQGVSYKIYNLTCLWLYATV